MFGVLQKVSTLKESCCQLCIGMLFCRIFFSILTTPSLSSNRNKEAMEFRLEIPNGGPKRSPFTSRAILISVCMIFMTALCSYYAGGSFSGHRTVDFEGTDFLNDALVTHEDASSTSHAGKGFHDDSDPIAAALADHGDSQFVQRRLKSKVTEKMLAKLAEERKEASWRVANEKAREEHPWDDTPEGMPTKDGRMISAADMASGMDSETPNANSYALQSIRSAAQFIKAKEQQARHASKPGLYGSVDPTAVSALDGALVDHEGDRSRAGSPQQARASPNTRRYVRNDAGPNAGPQAAGPQGAPTHQGFVTGSHLRVTPKEFYHEMKRFLPSSSGRLISPFEWFQTGGQGYSR
jgi:hypothetical protein